MEFMQQNAVYMFIGVVLAWFVWQRVIGPRMAGVKSIGATEYMQMRDKEHTLLDVRQQGEWRAGHAPAAIHIPLGELKQRMDEVSKDKPVIVICASGNRSSMAATALGNTGHNEVYNFSGGMGAWGGAGLPVKTGD